MMYGNKFKLSLAIGLFVSLSGCTPSPFILEPPDRTNLMHRESGLYVHRETELRVNAARFETPPEGTEPGAVPEFVPSRYFRLGTSSTYFAPLEEESSEDELFWREVTHVSKDDLKGKTAVGAQVRWEKEGAARVYDALEIFDFPLPDVSQIDTWSPWIKATRSREGSFGWHAEANKHDPETPAAPAYPFQMRFRLVLSKRMYP